MLIEALEARDVPAAPFIRSVVPADGASLTIPNPVLAVTFSENVKSTQAQNTNNYLLFDSSGQRINITNASYNSTTFTVTLTYAGGTLPVDTYTLFVRGDQISDVDENLFMAAPGQVVVANNAQNTVAVVGVNADGSLGALNNLPTQAPPTSAPRAVALHDLDGDGIAELIVANGGANSLSIYQSDGVGYGLAPALTVALPTGATTPFAIVTGDFDGDGKADIVTANSGTNNVTLFLNTSTTGNVQLAAGANTTVGATLVGMTAGDFDADGIMDIALANSNASSDLNGDSVNDYRINVLRGSATGLTGLTSIRVGDVNSSLLTTPSGIAAGIINNDTPGPQKIDLVVSGANGILVLTNASNAAGNIAFNLPASLITTTATTSVAVGVVRNGGSTSNRGDIVATTATGGTGGQGRILVFENDGSGNFTALQTLDAGTAPLRVTVADLNGDNDNDVLVVNDATAGRFLAFLNNGQTTNPLNNPVTVSVDSNPSDMVVGDVNGDNIPDVITANRLSDDVSVVRGNGDGTFQTATLLVGGNRGNGVAIGDLNNDGLIDLVVVNRQDNAVRVYLATAPGVYPTNGTAVTTVIGGVGRNPVAVGLARLTTNGPLDIVVASEQDDVVTILSNNGSGVFTTLKTVSVGRTPNSLAIADFNEDGLDDIAVGHNRTGGFGGGGSSNRGVTIRLSTGNRNFGSSTELASGIPVSAVIKGDFNRDGHADLAVADGGAPGSVRIYTGTGTGVPTFSASFGVAPNPVALAVGDFNADGYQDIAAVSRSDTTNSNISVLLNSFGTGFSPSVGTTLVQGARLQAIAVTELNGDVFPDVVVTITPGATGAITGATNASPIVITSNNHGLSTGDQVTISGVNGNTAANGTWTITRVDGNRFSLNGSTGNGSFTSSPNAVWTRAGAGSLTNNVVTMLGVGDGTFNRPQGYLAGNPDSNPYPSYVAVLSSPLIRATTFTTGGTTVRTDLVSNGSFETRDLNGEQGNLVGWRTFSEQDSHGAWSIQFAGKSPLSQATVPGPTGTYAAMLDQPDLQPFRGNNNPNPDDSYEGTHILYQDIAIPNNASVATLSLRLYYVNSANAFSDTATTATLDYRTSQTNQQIRVDIMDPTADIRDVSALGVLRNLFITTPASQNTRDFTISNVDLLAFAGRTIRLRIAAANNNGKLIVGVDNVQLRVTFSDSTAPLLNNVGLRDPGYLVPDPSNPGSMVPTTGDPTIIGRVSDNSGLAGLRALEFDINGDGFTTTGVITGASNASPIVITSNNHGLSTGDQVTISGVNGNTAANGTWTITVLDPNTFSLNGSTGNGDFTSSPSAMWTRGGADDIKISQWDANGNFSFTVPVSLPGRYNVGIRLIDAAGNITVGNTISFNLQGSNTAGWQSYGPGPIDVSAANVNYSTLTGRVTEVIADPFDLTGQTYYVGSANGGVWKTTNSGQSWTPLMDFLTDNQGNPVPASIGALAISRVTGASGILYAATGVADAGLDSRPGVGVFKSTDGGQTWTLAGNSGTVLGGARISKVVISNTLRPGQLEPDVYVAVASGGQDGPGVYKSTDGGQTWVNVLRAALLSGNMIDNNGQGSAIPTTTELPSVTDMAIDPFNSNDIIIGLGNIGLVNITGTNIAGVWKTADGGQTWFWLVGGDNLSLSNNTLPSGAGVGRVTVARPTGRPQDDAIHYVLIGNAGPNIIGNGQYDLSDGFQSNSSGSLPAGLYKTKNGGLDWTKVMLREDTVRQKTNGIPHNFVDINLLGREANYVGALVVDPTNPNVVYVGGSRRFTQIGDPPTHALILVNTGNMRDTTYFDPATGTIPNDGDDIDKVNRAVAQGGYYDPPPPDGSSSGNTDPYTGEGVFWFDLEQNQSGNTGQQRRLPPAIHSLTFDPLGRLLIGTEGGLWRGVNFGFGYDFTSGGDGILRGGGGPGGGGGSSFNPSGMRLTELNGNLAILSATTATVDPQDRTSVIAGFVSAGTAVTTGAGNWRTDSLNNLERTASFVTVALPSPNAPAGTLATIFRAFANTFPGAYAPETSTDGGVTFNSLGSAGISSQDTADLFPPLVVSPVKLEQRQPDGSVLFFDRLLFGTDNVYLTETSTALWNPVSSNIGNITALAFPATAPGAVPGFYAGTATGEVYVDLKQGTGPQLRTNGLPVDRINGFATDPINPSIAYVVLGGRGHGHVFRTTNGGLNWTDISGRTTGARLPDLPVNAIVYDDRITSQTPQGRIYVATDVGVFISLDQGTSWRKVGIGLPNVPVVGLQFNKEQETLVAATQGRGVFLLSTDVLGPKVVSVSTPTNEGGLNYSVTVTFNETIDPVGFNAANVRLDGPSGPITPLTLANVDAGLNKVFKVTFTAPGGTITGVSGTGTSPIVITSANHGLKTGDRVTITGVGGNTNANGTFTVGAVTTNTFTLVNTTGNGNYTSGGTWAKTGTYRLTILPNITDVTDASGNFTFVHNRMNQNQNSTNGEDPRDSFTHTFYLNSTTAGPSVPVILGRAQELGAVFALETNGNDSFIATRGWDNWAAGPGWMNTMSGDFDGDGKSDVISRFGPAGTWWVALSNGNSLTQMLWGTWGGAANQWVDVLVGDFNGDGKDDIVGRHAPTGTVWVGRSTGTTFVMELWNTWANTVTWADVRVGDFNGDGKDDLVARLLQNGTVWVARSNGVNGFQQQLWSTWATGVTWVDVLVGDFNNDGKDDLVARVKENGAVWVAETNAAGTAFTQKLYNVWATGVTWADVQIGDFDGDGRLDLVGRVKENGAVWVARNSGSGTFTQQFWSLWSSSVTWDGVIAADFNGDGKTDIVSRVKENGAWFVSKAVDSDGNGLADRFDQTFWNVIWGPPFTWIDIIKNSRA